MLTKVDFDIIAKPPSWATVTRIHVRKRDGEVNVVEIEVVKAPVFELFLRRCLDLSLKVPSSQKTSDRGSIPT